MITHAAVRHYGWHFILADLALILFLLTLTALPADPELSGMRRKEARAAPQPEIAPAQALFRPVAQGQSLAAWLAGQPRDARATLTIFARHPAGGEMQAWQAAQALAQQAAASGVTVRTIIARGAEADLYASLAYDAPSAPAS